MGLSPHQFLDYMIDGKKENIKMDDKPGSFWGVFYQNDEWMRQHKPPYVSSNGGHNFLLSADQQIHGSFRFQAILLRVASTDKHFIISSHRNKKVLGFNTNYKKCYITLMPLSGFQSGFEG